MDETLLELDAVCPTFSVIPIQPMITTWAAPFVMRFDFAILHLHSSHQYTHSIMYTQ